MNVMDQNNKPKVSKVEEHAYGVYVWYTADGRRVEDEDGNIMNIPSRRGDFQKIKAIQDAAKYYGAVPGRAVFIGGSRPVTDEEHQEMVTRHRLGLVPDPYDYRAIEEELRYSQKYGD